MPLARIALAKGKSLEYRRAIADGVHRALVETFDVPADDRFQLITEHDAETLIFDPNYAGIARSADFVAVQLTVSNTRGVAQKKALYRRIVANLAESPGIRPEDVFINLVEVARENWSFGKGEAQYA